MVRKLKHHEKKLLKKVDFINWESLDGNLHEVKVMRRFHVQKRDEYTAYNKMARAIRDLARRIRDDLHPKSTKRAELGAKLLEKLHGLGLVPTKADLELCDGVNATRFCRRRLPVVMVRSNMCENVKSATQLVESGHVRVGADVVKDPAFLVTRGMEDFVTWTETSAIRKKVLEYKAMRDDYDMYC